MIELKHVCIPKPWKCRTLCKMAGSQDWTNHCRMLFSMETPFPPSLVSTSGLWCVHTGLSIRETPNPPRFSEVARQLGCERRLWERSQASHRITWGCITQVECCDPPARTAPLGTVMCTNLGREGGSRENQLIGYTPVGSTDVKAVGNPAAVHRREQQQNFWTKISSRSLKVWSHLHFVSFPAELEQESLLGFHVTWCTSWPKSNISKLVILDLLQL